MLDLESREKIERSILGSFIEFPQIGFRMVDRLSKQHFTSDHRQMIFQYIHDEKKGNRQVLLEDLQGKEWSREASLCVVKGHLPNLKGYISLLIEERCIDDMFKLGQKLQDMAVNDSSLENMVRHVTKEMGRIKEYEADEHSLTMDEALKRIESGEASFKEYFVKIPTIDNYMAVSSQSITVIGGNEGTFKTKLMIFIIRMLMHNYDNISVLWYSMEDPTDKLIRGFISQKEFITDNELKKIEYKALIPEDVPKYDIKFVTKSRTIQEIGEDYASFREEREGRFCILIIDNLMKVIPMDRKIDPDMEILREIESWNIKTSINEACVYLLHHFVKGVQDDKRKDTGYTPKIADLRGSGRYKDAVTHAVLVNPMYSYAEIIQLFKGYEDFISHLYIGIIAKNRNNIKTSIILIAYPEYNLFFEI